MFRMYLIYINFLKFKKLHKASFEWWNEKSEIYFKKKKRLAERKSARKLKTVIKLKYTVEALKSKHQQ